MIINLISGPRNISTALMYAFAQRDDTKVVDEPFYANYLTNSKVEHPGKSDIMKSMPIEEKEIVKSFMNLGDHHRIVFLKNMAHHQHKLDWSYMKTLKNLFLIRNPKQLIASFAQVIPNPTMQDIGIEEEVELFEYLTEHGSHMPIIVDSNDLLKNPKEGLEKVCSQLEIPFSQEMLSWDKGGISEDGVWAKYWYKNVHDSTSFKKQSSSERPLPENCRTLYEQALPHYNKLKTHSLSI